MPAQFSIEIGKNGSLRLFIPSAREGSDAEYSVQIPCEGRGAKMIRTILTARATGGRGRYGNGSLLGTEASPTQQMVEQWLVSEANEIMRIGQPSAVNRARADKIADEINLDGLELSL